MKFRTLIIATFFVIMSSAITLAGSGSGHGVVKYKKDTPSKKLSISERRSIERGLRSGLVELSEIERHNLKIDNLIASIKAIEFMGTRMAGPLYSVAYTVGKIIGHVATSNFKDVAIIITLETVGKESLKVVYDVYELGSAAKNIVDTKSRIVTVEEMIRQLDN